jgi:ribosomal-protein-serine acetyltransferase
MFQFTVRPGVELRLLEERDTEAVFTRIDRDRAYLREWLPFVEATHAEDDTRSFIRASLEQFASNEGFAAGIWCEEQFAGVIGTRKIDWMNFKVEIGYWIGREFQGRGIMTDACRALVDYVFSKLELNRVEIQCATGNTKSAAIPKRLGFKLEGTRREAEMVNGRYLDLLIFGMLKREWPAPR